ncbi:hypothetical protein [Mesorhizobium japonicum]|uniref:hypothetical protein n=1 Tax=Mesorhizobium japonicum TaxID=2066070 RepID=UPI003B5A7107
MPEALFLEHLPAGLDIHPRVAQLLHLLEEGGWKPRKVIDGEAIRYWPDNERRRQIVVDLTYPPNQHKLDFYREHTQLELLLSDHEEE